MSSDKLRQTILAEQQKIASKSRFGLFTQPPPLAVGDDSPYKSKQHPKGEDGKPVTKPRNLLAGTNRSGMGKKGYFGVLDSIYKGDKYVDPFKLEMQYQAKMHTRSSLHETEFKPASFNKTLAKSSYEYKEQGHLTQKKRKLDQNGRVFTLPKNITTNPTEKVERQFMKNPQHIVDPYERKKQQERKDQQVWRSKMPQSNWKTAHNSLGIFNKSKLVYGEDDQAKRILAKKKQPRKMVMKTVAHEADFVPAVKNVHDTIGKYPLAMSAQSMQSLRPKTTDRKDKEQWRPNGYPKSKPTPSISLNRRNIHVNRYK